MRRITWILVALVALAGLATPAMAQYGPRGYGQSYGRSNYYGGYGGYARPYTSYYRNSPYSGYSTYGSSVYSYPAYGYPAPGAYQNYAPGVYSYPVNPGYGGYYSTPGFSVGIGY